MRGPRTRPLLIALRSSTVPNPPRESMSTIVVKPASRSRCALWIITNVWCSNDSFGTLSATWTCASIMPGQDRRAAQVDHARAGRDGDVRADVRDAVAANQHDLIRQHRAGPRVEQPSRANRGDLEPLEPVEPRLRHQRSFPMLTMKYCATVVPTFFALCRSFEPMTPTSPGPRRWACLRSSAPSRLRG